MGTEQAPNADEDIDKKKADGSYDLTDAERKEKKRLRQANGNAYINLQLSCEDLPYDLVSLAKTEELPDGCARDAWERLTSEYDLTEGEDKITLLTMFQQNQLEDVRTNITVWLTSLAMQVNKLKKLHHVLDEEYQITHILASLPREYSSVVEQVKIDRRTSSTLITMDEVKKRLKERYLQLKKEHGWSEDEMALSMKSGNNQNKNIKKGSKGKYFKGRCNHCGKFGHKKADCWDLKNKKEKHQENEKKVQKDKSKVRCFKCGKLGHYANECKNDKESSGGGNNETFAMTCFEDEKDDKNENGDDENKFEAKNSEDDERKVGPGVGSPQVSFLMCTLEIPQNNAVQVLCSFCLPLLLSLFSNYELFMYFCFCSFFHSYGSFNHDIFNILDLLWVSCTLFIHIFTLFMYRKSSCTFICQVALLTSSCQFSTFHQCSLLPQASLSFI